MLAPTVKYPPQSIPFPVPKTRLLLVSDSLDRLKALKAGLNPSDYDVTAASSFEELTVACHEHHDLVALDVHPKQIARMLKLIRSSAPHTTIPVLVEATRLKDNFNLAGLLPHYRAMPCSYTEMLALVRRRNAPVAEDRTPRGML